MPSGLGPCMQGLCQNAVDDASAGYTEDFVIATGEQYSVRQFGKWSAKG